MNIVCIGWGSLIWNPQDLLIEGTWHNDGPLLPLEFLRESRNKSLTLVISRVALPQPTLWIKMRTDDLKKAKESLRVREGKCYSTDIGALQKKGRYINGVVETAIKQWMDTKDIDAVIWTALPPKFNTQNGVGPTLGQALSYLRGLSAEDQKNAEEYIRNAPVQVNTLYRQAFEKEFGWSAATPDAAR